MRQRLTTQRSIFSFRPEHEIGEYLDRVSGWLDQASGVIDWVSKDLKAGSPYGRPGMTCEQVVRAGILMQYRQCSYRGLEFVLKDSLSFQFFCRVDPLRSPGKSTLRANISAIRPSTWRKINRLFIQYATGQGFETGSRLRIDSTVAETNILFPTDSKLLYDGIRLMNRAFKKFRQHNPETDIRLVNHCRRAKRHSFAAVMARNDAQRYPHYKVLLRDADATRLKLIAAQKVLQKQGKESDDVTQLLKLVEQVMSQSMRRVVLEESVPADEKVVSMHEPHSDIILKGARDVQFGHKMNLTSGSSGLILDVSIERGNPADSSRLLPMLRRHKRLFGCVPQAIATDGGYASRENLEQAKALGVTSVAFDKRRNLSVEEMTGDDWLYRELKGFRAGIEASISYLKRCFGLRRVRWKGWQNFQSSIFLSVLSHNLIVWARSG